MNYPSRFPNILTGFSRILHGGDYNPDQWLHAPEVIDEDFRLMPLSGCNTFSVGIFAWGALEPEPGRYNFGWLDNIIERLAAQGSKVILATPSGGKPGWLAQAYPEIRRVNREGQRDPLRDRHNHCWTSPIYRERVRAINTALAQRYGRHPALGMWHVSNEYSGACYCDLCRKRFQEWLRERYGTLERLNRAWWTGFWSKQVTDWAQIEPTDYVLDAMALDWLRFTNWQLIDFMRFEMEPLRQISPEVPCTTNFMGTLWSIDYAQIAQSVDVVTEDQYPCYNTDDPGLVRSAIGISFKHDLYRNFKAGRPFMLMESCPGAPQWRRPQKLKRPGIHRLEMLQAIAGGADGTCYFQWRAGRGGLEKYHGAVVEHTGTEHARTFQTVAELSRTYEKLTPILGSTARAEVGLLYDWESKWAQRLAEGPGYNDGDYDAAAHDHYEAFWRRGISVDVVGCDADWSRYRLLVAPQLWMLRPGVADRLRAYVAGGGTLVATYDTGMADASNLAFLGGWPGEGLRDVFGFWIEEIDRLGAGVPRKLRLSDGVFAGLGRELQADGMCALGHLTGARALAVYDEDFYAGRPAITDHRWGGGRAIYLAARLGPGALSGIYGHLLDECGIEPVLPGVSLPEGVTVQARGAGAEQFVFFLSFSAQATSIGLAGHRLVCLETGQPAGEQLDLPAFASRVFRRGG